MCVFERWPLFSAHRLLEIFIQKAAQRKTWFFSASCNKLRGLLSDPEVVEKRTCYWLGNPPTVIANHRPMG